MKELRNRCKTNDDMPIQVEAWTESEVMHKVDELQKSGVTSRRVSGKVISKLYSYDFADNERYQDILKYAIPTKSVLP